MTLKKKKKISPIRRSDDSFKRSSSEEEYPPAQSRATPTRAIGIVTRCQMHAGVKAIIIEKLGVHIQEKSVGKMIGFYLA